MKYKNISNSLYIKGRIGWKGLKKKEYLKKSGYRIINGSNISNGKINWSDCGYITKQRYFESPEIMLQKGDILVTKDGTIGKVALVEDLVQPSTIASGLFIVRNKATAECDTLFLYYYLQTRKFKEFIHSRTEGSVIPHLYQKDFKEFKIPDISLANQRQISSKLNYIQKKITLNNQLNDNLDELMTLIFEKFINKNKFKKESLSNIANYQNGLAMKNFPPKNGEKGLPVLKIKELNQGYTDFSSDRCTSKIDNSVIVHVGDIVFSWSGTLLVKNWSGNIAGLNQHLFKVTSKIFPEWFIYEWTKYYLRKFQIIAAGKATTMGHIKRSDINNSIVYVPNKSYLNDASRVMNPIYNKRIEIIKENQQLNTIKQVLLHNFF